MKYAIVGTAAHIDHGKSALVQALTGTDPDRLEEEKPPVKALTISQIKPQNPSQQSTVYKATLPLLT